MTFPTLLTMSREECATHIAGPRDVCISIRSSSRGDLPPISPNYRAVLRLQFDDWPWADAPEESATRGFIQINEAIADDVIRFVRANLDATRLVVHCDVGASRSVSLAMALAKCFTGREWRPRWLRRHTFKPGTCAPNQIVYDAIIAAAAREGNAR